MHNTSYTFATDNSGKKREKRARTEEREGYSSTHCDDGTGSAGTRRRFVVCVLVAVAVAAVVVLAGCDETVAPDTTAPTISTATFATVGTTVSITVNEAGKLFWVAYADDTTAPTDAAALIADAGKAKTAPIIANSGEGGQAVATVGVQTISVSNLPNGTDYDFYAVAQDANSNASALSAKVDVRIALAQAITAGTVTKASGQISIPVTNPNTGAVRVRVGISPAVAGATYTIGGTAFSSAGTIGGTLAASATQTLIIGNLTNGTTYTISLTTVGSNGVAHSSVVNRSVALSAPIAFTVAAAVVTTNSGRVPAGVRLTWTNPSNASSIAVSLPTGAIVAPAVNTAAGAANTVVVGGLAAGTARTFTVTASNEVGNTTATTASVIPPALPVALWQASNVQYGDFGFAACQTELSGGATDTSGVHKTLYDAGYRTAKFFGSTPDYDFNDIATDADALGAVGTRPLVTAAGSSFTVREISSGTAVTLADFTKGANRNTDGDITSSAVHELMGAVVTVPSIPGRFLKRFWSFSVRAGTYDSTASCSGATSAGSPDIVITGRNGLVDTSVVALNKSFAFACGSQFTVLCIAK